jgi:hypothetical protein
MIIKILIEVSMVVLLIILLITTNKLQVLTQESLLNQDDVNYVNSLGWVAAWILCAFNGLCLLMMIMDYAFDLIGYLKKSKSINKKN